MAIWDAVVWIKLAYFTNISEDKMNYLSIAIYCNKIYCAQRTAHNSWSEYNKYPVNNAECRCHGRIYRQSPVKNQPVKPQSRLLSVFYLIRKWIPCIIVSWEKQPITLRAWAIVAWDYVRVVGLGLTFTNVKMLGPNKNLSNSIIKKC